MALSNDPSGEYFKKEIYEINFKSRFNTASLAKKYGVKRYILPYRVLSMVLIHKSKETSQQILTTYAKCNLMAEKTLKLSNFCVTILRFYSF